MIDEGTPVRPAHEPPSVLLGKLLTPIERVAPSAAEKNPFLKSEFGRPSTAPFADGSLGPWYQNCLLYTSPSPRD